MSGFPFANSQSLILQLLLTGTEEHLDASTETYTRVSKNGDDDDQSSHSPEAQGEESDKPDEYSGNIPLAKVAAASEELGSGVDTFVVDGDAVTLLTVMFVSMTPPTPSLEAELSSSESSASTATLEDLREVESVLRTMHSIKNEREHDAGEGSDGSSGESEEEDTSVILSADDHPVDQDVTNILIPHQTLTVDWEPESSSPSSSTFSSASLSFSPYTSSPSSASQKSHPDESSAESRATEESDHVSKENHVEITTGSIRSCELGRNINKLFLISL